MKSNTPFDVVITCNYSPWSSYKGGGQKSVHMLAEAMAAEGRKVCVVFSKVPWEAIPLPADLPYEVRWAFFIGLRPGVSSPLRFLNGLTFLPTVRRLCGPDTLLIGNGDEASLYWTIRSRGKLVFGSRNTYDDFLKGSDWTRLSTWIRILFKEPRFVAVALAARRADVSTCTSGFSLEQLRQCFGIPGARAAVIPNGLDPLFFRAAYKESGQTGVLFFGRLAANKGAHHALEAFLRLPPEQRRAHPLTFAGDGPLKDKLERTAREAGAANEVIFSGWLSSRQLAEAITSCRLVLLPSLEESFGNAILETLATGQNLISTTACAIPEVAGPYGTLVASGDVAAMASAMARELSRIRGDGEIEEQRRYFQDRFSWRASARMYLDLESAGRIAGQAKAAGAIRP
ncbi:MAG: glycosyltransferase family 1 protein [Fibrobacteres bacterium]|nr:glycosyltransferase family 1 protein [Fibrobacterota bacterium]